MQYSIANYSDTKKEQDCRIDAEFWHPLFLKNSSLVSNQHKIGNFVDSKIANIRSSPINRDFDYLEISNINYSGYKTKFVRKSEEPDRAHSILSKKDVAVSTVRPNRNAVAFITEDKIIGSSGLSILRACGIEAEYLYAFCKTNYFTKCLVRATKATMYPAVSRSHIENVPILVSTPNFRKRIKKLIDKFLTLRILARQEFQQAQTILLSELGLMNWNPKHQLTFVKNYVDTIRAARNDAEYFQPKYNEIVNSILSYSGGWNELGNVVTIKKCVEVGSREYMEEGIPFIRVSNLSQFEITEEKYISEFLYQKNIRHQPQKGEILLSKDATPGIAYYLDQSPSKMIPSSGILRLMNKSYNINNEYLTLVLNSILSKEQINRDAGGSVILHWRLDQVEELLIPILPEVKQIQIQRNVAKSFLLHQRSNHLLDLAKQAIDLAIEHSEKLATDWMDKHQLFGFVENEK